jgi:hypothetical protein
VRLRQHEPQDRERQNYPAFHMPDGSVPVLEATVVLHSAEHPDWREMTLGIPVAMLLRPHGEHRVALSLAGAHWRLCVDGELVDNDYPFGYPRWPEPGQWRMDPAWVRDADLHVPGIAPQSRPSHGTGIRTVGTRSVQYWMPPGHNSWVGDVATISHGGRYHVFYLYDRRHHRSKFGCGAHYFEHLSTADLRTWTEHEAATPLEEQWECIGTGVPFVHGGRLCLSYGLHTTRVYPREQTLLPAQWQHLEQHGHTGTFRRGSAPGVPAGSTYAVCTDGVAHFDKSHVLFHPCENPSVFTDPEGRLRLLANAGADGIWESDRLDGGWRCISPGFPPGGDCTFYFRWGRFDYLIGGFTGVWRKRADEPISAYQDLVGQGLDFYDGSNVPCVTPIADGRFLMAAWIPIRGWGGTLLVRQLLQHEDGRIGARWPDELTPAAGPARVLAERVTGTQDLPAPHRAFLLSFVVEPQPSTGSRVAVALLPHGDETPGCELQVRPNDERAQFAKAPVDGFAADERSLREGGAPHQVGDYAIERLTGTRGPFAVRVVVKGCDKIGGTLVDAEIAGQRTMISYRPELVVARLVLRTEGAALADVQVAPLTD